MHGQYLGYQHGALHPDHAQCLSGRTPAIKEPSNPLSEAVNRIAALQNLVVYNQAVPEDCKLHPRNPSH